MDDSSSRRRVEGWPKRVPVWSRRIARMALSVCTEEGTEAFHDSVDREAVHHGMTRMRYGTSFTGTA